MVWHSSIRSLSNYDALNHCRSDACGNLWKDFISRWTSIGSVPHIADLIDSNLSRSRIRVSEQVGPGVAGPRQTRPDNGGTPRRSSYSLVCRAGNRRPDQNTFVERFNRTSHTDGLNASVVTA